MNQFLSSKKLDFVFNIKKLRGGSIIEIIVAMIIVSLTVGLAGSFIDQVLNTSDRMIKLSAWYEVNKLKNEIFFNNDIENDIRELQNYMIQKEVEAFDNSKGLWLVHLVAKRDSSLYHNEELILVSTSFFLEFQTDLDNVDE